MSELLENTAIQPSQFDVISKIEQSTTSVTELRVPIFAPVQKLSGNSTTAQAFKKSGGIRVIRTSWGKVEIRGRKLLTQVHRDLLDCIYSHATEVQYKESGEVTIAFSQGKVLREYSRDKSESFETNTKWLKEKIEEIRDVTIKFESGTKNSVDFNLIRYLDYDDKLSSYCITLDKRYLRFYEQELSIGYKKELPKLLKVDSALIRALISWFFTHKDESKYKLITVLEALGFPIESPKSLQVAKREIKSRIGELMTFGIEYDPEVGDGMFYYKGNENVSFIPPLFKNSKQAPAVESKKPNFSELSGKSFEATGQKSFTVMSVNFDENMSKATIIGKEGGKFSIDNNSSLSAPEFEIEVYGYLQQLLFS